MRLRQRSTNNQPLKTKKIKISKNQVRNYLKSKIVMKSLLSIKKGPNNQNKVSLFSIPYSNQKCKSVLNVENFNCPVCLELIIRPITINCGHAYCLKCIEQTSTYTNKCCICRQQYNIDIIQPSNFIEQIIQKSILIDNENQVQYWCRQQQFNLWESKRRIDTFKMKEGDLVDIRDNNKIWRAGMIKIITLNCKNVNAQTFIINYMNIDDQPEINQNSRRLAPFGFFTKGQYQHKRFTNYNEEFTNNIVIPEIQQYFTLRLEPLLSTNSLREELNQHVSQNRSLYALELFQFEMQNQSDVLIQN